MICSGLNQTKYNKTRHPVAKRDLIALWYEIPFFNGMVVFFMLLTLPAFAEAPVVPVPAEKPFAQFYIGETRTYIAKYEDTLVQIARDNILGFVELRAANAFVDPWLPGEGTEITIPSMHLLPDAPREGIIINLPEMRLYAFVEKGKPPLTFPIGIGREGLHTPVGTTSIVRKKEDPSWVPTHRMKEEDPELPKTIPPGPENPLGTHALYLGWPEYAIHGTNRPFGIGRRVSSGCIRLYPKNIIELFDAVDVGMPVRVIDQTVKVAWIGDELYLEAHLMTEQTDRMEKSGGRPDYKLSNSEIRLIVDKAGEDTDLLDWPVIREVIKARSGYPVVIARRVTVEAGS